MPTKKRASGGCFVWAVLSGQTKLDQTLLEGVSSSSFVLWATFSFVQFFPSFVRGFVQHNQQWHTARRRPGSGLHTPSVTFLLGRSHPDLSARKIRLLYCRHPIGGFRPHKTINLTDDADLTLNSLHFSTRRLPCPQSVRRLDPERGLMELKLTTPAVAAQRRADSATKVRNNGKRTRIQAIWTASAAFPIRCSHRQREASAAVSVAPAGLAILEATPMLLDASKKPPALGIRGPK